jgi:Asp-tRNA(Asn)/Glu-tRNA(Gln) amidotransferase B subunit
VEVGDILAEAMPWAVDEVLSDQDKPVSEVVGKYRPRESDSEVLETVLVQVVERMKSAGRRGRDEVLQWGVGEVMREFFGRIPSQEVLTRLAALFDPEKEVSEGKVGQ